MHPIRQISYIRKRIAEGEHKQQDFKYAVNDSRKIAKSLVAFANSEGGRLLIGVRDNGSIAGVKSDEEFHMVEAAAQMYCKPEVPFETRKWQVEGKDVLEIIVNATSKRPVMAQNHNNKWLAYIRVEDQNLLANGILLKVWRIKQKRDRLNQGVHLQYTETEKKLLNFLDENRRITLNQFRKLANIQYKAAEKTLINLILMNIIEIEFTEQRVFYYLKEQTMR